MEGEPAPLALDVKGKSGRRPGSRMSGSDRVHSSGVGVLRVEESGGSVLGAKCAEAKLGVRMNSSTGQGFGPRRAWEMGQGPGERLCEPRSGVWSLLRVTGFPRHQPVRVGAAGPSAVWRGNWESSHGNRKTS